MPRYAIGDLLIDLDIPEAFRCEYTLTGSLLARDSASEATLEVSGLTIAPKNESDTELGAEHVIRSALEAGLEAKRYETSLVTFREPNVDPPNWLAGLGNRVVIATLAPESPDQLAALEPTIEKVIASIDVAHDVFVRNGKEPAISALRASHALWFAERRAAIRADTGWNRDSPIPVEKLDAFWDRVLSAPVGEAKLQDWRLSTIAVAFGDHLVAAGFDAADGKGDGGPGLVSCETLGKKRNAILWLRHRSDHSASGKDAARVGQLTHVKKPASYQLGPALRQPTRSSHTLAS